MGLQSKEKRDVSMNLMDVGYGNMIPVCKVVAILTPGSAPMKRLREVANKEGKLLDVTQGRRTRALVILETDHLVLSAVQVKTLTARYSSVEDVDKLQS